jgi:hypothetical protein
MSEGRRYTVEEADALLPELRERLPRLRTARAALVDASERISEAVAADGGGVAGSAWFAAQQALRAELEWLIERDILLRDPQSGLVDFPSERDGAPVYLCWRVGEERVAHFHGERAGFAGRTPL